MSTVSELSDAYANFMFGPRPGPEVCSTCFNFTRGYDRCYCCLHGGSSLAVVTPVSYSVAGEQLHRALRGYKRLSGPVARRLTAELAAVLWRFLARHETCIARAVGARRFARVTTVPSGDCQRDSHHPLRSMVGVLVRPTSTRYEPLLRRSRIQVPPRQVHPGKFECLRKLDGEPVLLIDDTWTTGASARSAAAALVAAGAGPVAAVVIGRHLNRGWHENDRKLRELRRPFDWNRCAVCGSAPGEPIMP